jgi:hypothetical protein
MADAIALYFAQYSDDFKFIPGTTDWRQMGAFNSLAGQMKWSNNRRRDEFEQFKQTWCDVAESEFGDSTLPHYQSLCEDLRISPIPNSVTSCKSALSAVFVNIVDLVQYRKNKRARRGATPVTLFDSLSDLQNYSEGSKKWYPKQTAKAEMLRELLKVLQ